MVKLIKADLYRYSRTKLIYIILSLNELLTLVKIFPYIFLEEYDYTTINAYNIILDNLSSNGVVVLFTSLLACILISQEISYRTIRNKVIIGNKPWLVYLSLTLSTTMVSVIIYLGTILFNGVMSTLLIGYGRNWDGDELSRLVKLIVVSLNVNVLIFLIAILIAFIFRHTVINIMVLLLFSYILNHTILLTRSSVFPNFSIQLIEKYVPFHQLIQCYTVILVLVYR